MSCRSYVPGHASITATVRAIAAAQFLTYSTSCKGRGTLRKTASAPPLAAWRDGEERGAPRRKARAGASLGRPARDGCPGGEEARAGATLRRPARDGLCGHDGGLRLERRRPAQPPAGLALGRRLRGPPV